MTIYIPYFYVIQDIRNGMYYAGAKWAADASPSNFMIEGGYNTSSKIIKELIQQNGLSNFIVRKIRTFKAGPGAYEYETRFLQKVNACGNPKFYNGHNNDGLPSPCKMKQVMMELYGVEYYTQSEEYRQRYHKTCMEKYGFPFHTQSETTKETMRNTNMEKYGVENTFQAEWAKEKIKETNMKNLGVPFPMMSDVCKEKSKQTFVERYGVENAMHSEEIKETMRNNNMEKYGVENTFQAEWAKEKTKETLIDRYGVEHPMYSEEIKETLRNNNMEKYGVENTFQTEWAKEKIKVRMDYLLSRPQLDVIRRYQKKYKIKFGQGWVRKSDMFIDNLLDELKQKYGNI